ncbi:MAG: 50S ribosomal protein L21 [Rickettsiales bacterium]|jgi:large subunit ribosomal protein L21|nr:50S ribosomal protein L21 [Rickettsiales bacterium]
MFAVVETSGRQYMVSVGNTIDIEKLDEGIENGIKLVLGPVLMVEDMEGKVLIGKPTLPNVAVEGEILREYRDKKVIAFKIRRRKNSRRKIGHRQLKMKVRITGIRFI